MINLSNILITGGESTISQELPFGIKLSREELDITNRNQIAQAIKKINPTAILNLASKDLHHCEKDPFRAYDVNVIGMYNLATEAEKSGIPVIMISSGAVFNGKIGQRFDENEIPNPQNFYGQSKYVAELLLQEVTERYSIIRTGWLFGLKHRPTGFSKFIDMVIDTKDENVRINATESTGSPTYINDFIEELGRVIKIGKPGTWHIVNSELGSAYDVAQEIAKITQVSKLIEKTESSEIIGNSKRSMSEALYSNKVIMRSWQEALRDYISNRDFR